MEGFTEHLGNTTAFMQVTSAAIGGASKVKLDLLLFFHTCSYYGTPFNYSFYNVS